ncbi:MAG: CopG family transcriptional regulator [Desulfurococcaceae archaeon]
MVFSVNSREFKEKMVKYRYRINEVEEVRRFIKNYSKTRSSRKLRINFEKLENTNRSLLIGFPKNSIREVRDNS